MNSTMLREYRHLFVTTAVRTWWLWPIVGAVITYFLIMMLAVGQSIWFDEAYSIALAKRPVAELFALTGVDAHPPLYYLLLKAWAGIFGWSEYALRSISAVAASLTVGVVFLLVRKLFTVRTALVALPFLVLAPFALRYGYEIRMYALAALIGAVASLVLLYAHSSKKKAPWVAYAVLVALGMYTLYMTAALWLAHVVWLFVVSKRKGRPFFKQRWVLAYIGAVALFVAYIPTLFYQLTHSALPGIGAPVTLTRFADIASMLVTFTPEWKIQASLSLALLAVIVLVTYLLGVSYRRLPKAQRSSLLFALVLVLVPLAFFAVSSLPKPIFVNRYMAHVAIFVYMLIGIAVALGWRFGRRAASGALAAIALLLLVVGVVQLQRTGNFVFERMQYPSTTEVRSNITCNDQTTVVADDPYTYIDSNYYFEGCDLRFFSADPVAKQGGYAPLYDSSARISSSAQVSTEMLVHLHWDGAKALFAADDRYELVSTTIYDKQVVDTYRLK